MLIRALALICIAAGGAPAVVHAQAADPQQLSAEIAFLEARVSRDEADPITPTRLGHAYLRQARETGEFALYLRAERAFEQALARAADHFGALTGLAAARAARHRFADALTLGERAIEVNPDAADGYAAVGDAALEFGLLDRAAGMYATVARMTPGYYAETRLANLAAAQGDRQIAYAALGRAQDDAVRRTLPPELRAWCHVRAGAIAFDAGDWARAERSYTAALRLTPRSYTALEHLAELRAAEGRHREALALYERAIEASAQPEFYEAMGSIYRSQGHAAAAARAFSQARDGYLAAAEAGDPGSFRRLALFYAGVERNTAGAVAWARKDVELRQDGITLGVLAWTLLQDAQRPEAAALGDRAAAANTADAMTWYRIGVVAMESGDRETARARLARALRINRRFEEAADARRRLRVLRGR